MYRHEIVIWGTTGQNGFRASGGAQLFNGITIKTIPSIVGV
jgi:hypothetical protein